MDYRICFELNRGLGLDFVKQKDLELITKNNEKDYGYSHFLYEDETNQLKYRVLTNKGDSSYLVKELSRIDYFFMIEGAWEVLDRDAILKKISKPEVVVAAFDVNPNQFESMRNLLNE